jgi:general secretion pathway protein A
LQILLVGQPELDEKLDSPNLRQLKQRIAHRAQLTALDLSETKGYVDWRLQVAGARPNNSLFPPEAIESVYRSSKGIPRLINTLCDNALISAYARKLRSVSPEIIENTAADLRLDIVHLPPPEFSVEFDENFARRASKTLLELFSYLKKTPARQPEQERP